MGKKGKTGKSRKDKFYQLAKETGYRSRAAFKLIQLNRKFEFLQKSRVVVDLCAAPGGWTQVAAQNTPISSVIIGIDLVPIKAIPNAITIQADITTETCRQHLKKNLQTWKADCFLNDGSPNIGKNWIHDAFQQNQLTLQAAKLSAEFLKKGGWFISKVFRSKDYFSLMWIFKQLFKKVHATKPQASRNESAEIFIVCENFLAPDKIDPKFFDPKYVFKEIHDERQPGGLDLMHPEKRRRHREGYADGDYTLFHTLKATEFISSDKFLELLSHASEIILDDDRLKTHSSNTAEMKECLKDIKVLGKKEIRNIITWRKKMRKLFNEKDENDPEEKKTEEKDEDSEDEDEKIQKKLAQLEEAEKKATKKKQKKIRREKIKLQHKMDMKMVLPGDLHEFVDDDGLFKLDGLKNEKELGIVEEGDLSMMDVGEDHVESSSDDEELKPSRKFFARDDKDGYLDSINNFGEHDIEEFDLPSDDEDDGDDEDEEVGANPLLVNFEDEISSTDKSRLKDWFSKDSFAGLEDDDADEDMDIERMAKKYERKGGTILKKAAQEIQETKNSDKKKKVEKTKSSQLDGSSDSGISDESDSDDSDSSDSDSDGEYDDREFLKGKHKKEKLTKRKDDSKTKNGFEIVPLTDPSLKLDSIGLAMGSAMVGSKKRKRDMIDGGYHRYMYDDDNLPEWFADEEKKHTKRQLPVTKEEIQHYKEKMKVLDARPIKKIAQAKARKHRKLKRREDKARKKAEVITDSVDCSEKEKWSQVKQIYKKAGLLNQKKKDVKYVVAKKASATGKRAGRPKGMSGPYRVVDKRMKADKRNTLIKEKKNKKGKSRKRPRR